MCLELIPIWIGGILIRQNDADPTRYGSGSTTLITGNICYPDLILEVEFAWIFAVLAGGRVRTWGNVGSVMRINLR